VINGIHFYLNNQGIVLDEESQNNIIDGNTSDQNNYGVVTQAHADNNIITNNTVNNNFTNGIYLRSSGNTIVGNTISQNVKEGLALALPASANFVVLSLTDNQLLSNTITSNGDNGVDIRGNVLKTLIGGNTLDSNKGTGIYLSSGPTQNTIIHNLIHANGKYGIQASGATTTNNTWSENSVYGNLLAAISLIGNANTNLSAPNSLSINTGVLSGLISKPNGTVEIFADGQKQAQYFLGRTNADATGLFTFALPQSPPGPFIFAVQIDEQNNASPLGGPATTLPPTVTPTFTPSVTPTPTLPDVTATVTPTLPVDGPAQRVFLPLVSR
jgi:parallel beta-helix repeat protein